MHCPPETPSPWQGSGESSWVLAIQKPKKNVYEGKIYMLFCNEFSICTIFTGDSMSKIPHPWCRWVQLFSSRKLIGFSILKAQENLFQRVRWGVKSTCNCALNCQFVLFSSGISSWHRGSRGRSHRKLMGFSVLKAQENPFQRVKMHVIL